MICYISILEGSKMLTYSADDYSAILGFVEENQHSSAARCVSQCTARVHAGVVVRVVLSLILSGRNCKMSADENQYAELFGLILTEMPSMPRCACVACNSCTCACSCRNTSDFDDIEW
jgi:Cys-rich radical ribosomally synthesized peptide